jgi:2-polyprenyl-3-methyl-5-hydroxy-6-metoxy-1,4-benzoquinol methylase
MSNELDESYWDFVQMKFKNRYNFTDLLPILNKYLDWIKKYVNGKARVLDVGCGFGYFLKLCDRLFWDTYGVDISNYAITIARKNTKAQLYSHDIQDIKKSPFKDNYFDLVTLFDVLEHLTSPITALKECRRILKYGGKLVITTPNLNAGEKTVLKILAKENTWHGFFDETHVNLFKPSSLKTSVEGTGFRTLELKTPFYSLPIAVNKILEKTGFGGTIWLIGEKPENNLIHHA